MLDAADLVAKLVPHQCIEGRKRLVEQQHVGLRRKGPDKRRALLLPCRDLLGVPVRLRVQLHKLQQFTHPSGDLRCRYVPHDQWERDVVAEGHVREQCVTLGDHPDGPLAGRHPSDVLAADEDLSAIGLQQTGDGPEQRRLPASRRPQQSDQFPGSHLQRYTIERMHRAKVLGHIAQDDLAHGSLPPLLHSPRTGEQTDRLRAGAEDQDRGQDEEHHKGGECDHGELGELA